MTKTTAKSWIGLTLAFGALATAVLFRPQTGNAQLSMIDVKRIAEANGFFAFANENELVEGQGQCHKMIISQRTLSEKELESLVMTNMGHPLWRECICIMRMRRGVPVHHAVPAPDDIVGDLLFFGDLEIIQAIKTHLARRASRGANGEPGA